MRQLKDAMQVLKIFKKHEHEAYIVGGAVRDYLLKNKINDIDITTSARPRQVLNIFKGIPTGEKYGTVTIHFREQDYQVTTYRSESGYFDNRHPEEVTFEENVLEDVKRRDFTMNSLLMDDTGKIFDHFEGMRDIKYKIIKTVGDPQVRFEEDALRMLRAFYFQSKLGFTIDKDTMAAIKDNRFLIKEVSAERVLDEMIKIIQGERFKMALSAILDTNVDEVLPGLAKGIKFFVQQDEMPFVDVFFTTSFALNGLVPSYWKFSNKHRHKYQQAVKLIKMETPIDATILYEYGLEISLLANRVLYLLGKDELKTNEITNDFNNLPINSSLDLKFRGRDILNITERKAGAWVNNLTNEMVTLVLEKKLANEKEVLKQYVLENFERF